MIPNCKTAKERLDLRMTVPEILQAMVGGNPGALRVCTGLLEKGAIVDPMTLAGGLWYVLMLDSLHIYESRIWMLYKDVCRSKIGTTMALIRAYQLGQLAGVTEDAINHAIDHEGEGLDLDAIIDAVKTALPQFDPSRLETARPT
jgi:hypothetical protein